MQDDSLGYRMDTHRGLIDDDDDESSDYVRLRKQKPDAIRHRVASASVASVEYIYRVTQ
jgi:hypothetical protein